MKITKLILKQIIKEEAGKINKKYNLVEYGGGQAEELQGILDRYKELVMDIQRTLDQEAQKEISSDGALMEIQSLIDEEGGSRSFATSADIGNMGDAIAEKADNEKQ